MTGSFLPLSREVAEQLREQVRRLLVQVDELRAQGVAQGTSLSQWMPAIDLAEVSGVILVRVELPGVDPAQVRLSLTDEGLRIEGRKDRPNLSTHNPGNEGPPLRFLCLERAYGAFHFSIGLRWQIDPTRITARMEEGILEIRLPRVGHDGQPISIPIQS
ncbi:MAG: Hsp20/alpha crystallin family protein [Blastocatellia bacterium]|jgi:HSP20 family protein